MIDKTVFAAEMTILRDRFGRRDMTAETIARYLDFLDPQLTTEQFQAAAREIFNRDTFWPSPARFLEAIQGNPKAMADEAWSSILEHAKRGAYPELATLPPPVRAALKAVPMREIMYADTDFKLSRLRKDFSEAYTRAAAKLAGDRPALEAPPEREEPDVLALFGMDGGES